MNQSVSRRAVLGAAAFSIVPRHVLGAAAGEGGPAIDQWLGAIKGGPASLTNFEIRSPVTEAFLLGCMAQRLPGERLEWDSAAGRVANHEKASRLVDPPARVQYRV